MKKEYLYRGFFYLSSMIILAYGITLNTKAGLGVSPIISVAYCVSEITGINFGDMTLVWYSVFVVVEIIIHLLTGKKRTIPKDVLQFPVSLVVTRFINLFVAITPDFAVDYAGSFWGSLAGRIIILSVAIILTGIGAAISLNMRVVPNPGDGIVQAIADIWKKKVGFTKNVFDISCVSCTVILSLLWKHALIGVGIGTVLAMIGVGRVVALTNHLFKEKMAILAGVKE